MGFWITFIRTREGWLYLAAILDVFNRKIVGWSIDSKLSHELLADALHKALRQRRPGTGVMFHSDRGTQLCQLCVSGSSGAAWFCSEHEFFRKLLRQRYDGIVFSIHWRRNLFILRSIRPDGMPMEAFSNILKYFIIVLEDIRPWIIVRLLSLNGIRV